MSWAKGHSSLTENSTASTVKITNKFMHKLQWSLERVTLTPVQYARSAIFLIFYDM